MKHSEKTEQLFQQVGNGAAKTTRTIEQGVREGKIKIERNVITGIETTIFEI